MQSLVEEVRRLRMAVERLGSTMPRMQITMQRLQIQEQKVAEASRQWRELRNHSMAASAEQAIEERRMQEMEEHVQNEQDLTRRKMFQEQRDAMKVGLERSSQMLQQTSAQEAEAATLLRLEQSKLDELSERLNQLLSSLDAPGRQP